MVIRPIFYELDKFIYALSRTAYSVFCYLSEISITGGDLVTQLFHRINAVLGIIMVFVIAYNLLTYIVSPDKVNEKNSGVSTLIKDLLIALTLIAVLPEIFTKLYSFQNTVITSGVISNLVIGGLKDKATGEVIDDYSAATVGRKYVENGGNNMVANIFTAFFTPADGAFSAVDCKQNEQINEEYCKGYMDSLLDGDINSFADMITDKKNYAYSWFWSTVGGTILTFFMLSFCLNLAKRVFKMAILECLGPVCLLLEVVPGKKGTRKNWVSTLVSVYFEVFIYQFTIFIIIFLVTLVPDIISNIWGGMTSSPASNMVKAFLAVFLIFGLLGFANEAPTMLCNLIGLKDTGTIKDASKRALAMGIAGGTLAGALTGSFAGRGFRNAVGSWKNSEGSFGKKAALALGSGLWGGISGSAQTALGVARGQANTWQGANQLRQQINARTMANADRFRGQVAQAAEMAKAQGKTGALGTLGVLAGTTISSIGAGIADPFSHYFTGSGVSNTSNSFQGRENLLSIIKSARAANTRADIAHDDGELLAAKNRRTEILANAGINSENFAKGYNRDGGVAFDDYVRGYKGDYLKYFAKNRDLAVQLADTRKKQLNNFLNGNGLNQFDNRYDQWKLYQQYLNPDISEEELSMSSYIKSKDFITDFGSIINAKQKTALETEVAELESAKAAELRAINAYKNKENGFDDWVQEVVGSNVAIESREDWLTSKRAIQRFQEYKEWETLAGKNADFAKLISDYNEKRKAAGKSIIDFSKLPSTEEVFLEKYKKDPKALRDFFTPLDDFDGDVLKGLESRLERGLQSERAINEKYKPQGK